MGQGESKEVSYATENIGSLGQRESKEVSYSTEQVKSLGQKESKEVSYSTEKVGSLGQRESKEVSYSIGQKKSQESNDKLLVAAFDFGTTFSGWAYSFKHAYDVERTNVCVRHWQGNNLISLKAPTAVLIKPDGETFDSFGYDAENKYVELVGQNQHKAWYYFRRFKMMLYGEKNLDRNMKLKDETNKSLSAIKVFSLVIRYLREDLLEMTERQLRTVEIKENEILWVLTVPAIWDDAAKQFMREAANMAGINGNNLMIALEPEVASLYCSCIPVDKMVQGGGMFRFESGSKYMVLDAGGGTIDITVNEVMPGCKLKEIYKATGGAWGGTKVDEAFEQFLITLVGAEVFYRFQTENKEDYLYLFGDFELKKRSVSPDSSTNVRLRFPSSLEKILREENDESMSKAIEKSRYVNQVSMCGDKMIINDFVMKGFFSEAIQSIVSHVRQLMKEIKVKEIFSILMVGGFSESKMLQEAIKSNFVYVKVIIPQDAGLVVLKGAVVFGHSPSSIAERVCKYTYGIKTTLPFDETVHDISKRVEYDYGPRCHDIFSKHVVIGQTVAVNEMTKERSYTPTTEEQTGIRVDIYASTEKSPIYVTDKECVKIGSRKIDIIDKTIPRDEREFMVSMCFGGTEIEVIIKEKQSGNTYKKRVNFLG